MNELLKLRKRAAETRSKMREIAKRAETEDRDLDEAEGTEFGKLREDLESLEARVTRLEEIGDGEADEEDDGNDEPPARRSAPPQIERRSGGPAVHTRKHEYSIMKAISGMADRTNPRLVGLEKEWSDEMATRSGRKPQGFFVPHHFGNEKAAMERRNLTLSTGAGMIPTVTEASIIDYLYNRTMVIKAGAQVITDMTTKFALPRLSGTSTAYWIAEGAAPTASNQTVDQVLFTPQTIGAYVDISRKTLMQSSVDAEKVTRGDLTRQVALGIDFAALDGSGSGNQPLGIAQNEAVSTVSLGTNSGAPTWAFVTELETDVAKANADVGTLSYMTSAVGRGTLKTTLKNPEAGYPVYLMENNEVNGYPCHVTNQVPSDVTVGSSSTCTPLFFGNWSDLVIALFGALDILVDPYTGSNTGNVRVNIFQDCDIEVRHAQSFAVGFFVSDQG